MGKPLCLYHVPFTDYSACSGFALWDYAFSATFLFLIQDLRLRVAGAYRLFLITFLDTPKRYF